MSRNSQRLYRSGQLALSDGVGDVANIPMLTGRARQLVHLTGYKFGFVTSLGALSDASRFIAGGFLRAISRDYNDSAYVFIFDDTPATPPLERHVVDFHVWSNRYDITTSGAVFPDRSFMIPWTPCDLVLPEVAFTAVVNNDMGGSTTYRTFCIVEYDWVDASIPEIAASSFAWGRDPQDYDREV